MFKNQFALPPELITEITGYLIDDKDSVLSSALTCHTWYNATRQCFYHKISISSKERLETLEELVDENPTIGCWVRILRVSEMHSVNWVIHIPGIARKLPNVRTLEMSKLWQHISHSNPEWFESLSQFTSIQHLSLDRCMFSVNFLKSLVSSLPHVKALSLARTNIDEYSFDIGSIFEVPYDEKDPEMPCLHEPRLEEFSVDTSVFSSCEGVCEWLRTTESVSTLRTIIYPIDSLTSFKEIGDLLVAAGGQLEYLECSMAKEVSKSVYPENGFAQYFKLGHHTGLRHIKVNYPRYTVPLFSALPDPSPLQCITFSIYFKRMAQFKNKDHKALDELLSSPQFSNLQRVCFEYTGTLDYETVLKKMQRVFKKLVAKVDIEVKMVATKPPNYYLY